MSADDNKALIRRYYREIDEVNIDAMDELVAEDYVDHSPPPFPGIGSGLQGLKAAFRMFWEATPGQHEIEDQIAEGDKVVTRLTAYGVHVRDLPGIPATGNPLTMTGTGGLSHREQQDRGDVVGQRRPRIPAATGRHAVVGPTGRRPRANYTLKRNYFQGFATSRVGCESCFLPAEILFTDAAAG